METIFVNTENSKTNESNKFIYYFTDKINLKIPNKNIALVNVNIYYTWKSIESAYNNNTIEISAPIWNDEFDLPDDHTLFQTFKIILNILLKNMRLQQIIHPYKFTLIELKIMLYLRLKQAIN